MSPFTLPEPVAFLELLKDLEPPDYDSAQQDGFDRLWDYIVKWLELRAPISLVHARPIIQKIARRLKNHPRLLYGLNCILQPHFRIECMTMQSTVTFYVLVADGHCEIQSVSSGAPDFPSTQEDLQEIMFRNDLWQELVGSISDAEWLACIAQILQEVLDDPSSEEACRQAARKRLYRFGKMGILPPSIFIHFVTPPPSYEHDIEHSESGGLCDAHKITVNSVPLCFRVVRQWLTSDSAKIYEKFSLELSVWRQLKHPNILPLIGATIEAFPRRYCFIVPWLLHGSIMSYLKTHPGHDRYLAISQIVDGVNYLHGLDPPVIHKDLKGENVLVRSDLVCVITDFGLSRLLDTQQTRTTGVSGTYFWMPPELFDEDGGESLPRDARPRDVYSLGCTIAQILMGKAPKVIWSAVIRREKPPLPPPKSPDWNQDELYLWDLVKKGIKFLPEERPTIQEVKRDLEVVRQSEPSLFESTQSSPREVDRRYLIGWIKSRSNSTPQRPDVPHGSSQTQDVVIGSQNTMNYSRLFEEYNERSAVLAVPNGGWGSLNERLGSRSPYDNNPVPELRSGLVLHHLLLAGSNHLHYDLTTPPIPDTTVRHSDYQIALTLWDQPATNPPTAFMRVESALLPWKIPIIPSQHSSPACITFNDIFGAIYLALREQVTQAEYHAASSRLQIDDAYRRRCKRFSGSSLYEQERNSGVRRADFLREYIMFDGLSCTSGNSAWWTLHSKPKAVHFS